MPYMEAPGFVSTYNVGNKQYTIRPLLGTDSFEFITELLHEAYRPLLDMGLRFLATHQDAVITKERCLDGYTFVVIDEEERITGTITLYSPKPDPSSEYYSRAGLWEFGQFAVLPKLQNMGIGSCLIETVERYAKRMEARELALNTSEKAVHLIEYYKKRGYEFREYVQWDVTNYRSVILSKMF